MATDHATPVAVRRSTLPASVTPARIEQLAACGTAAADAVRVTTNAPYTGAPLADLPVSTPADVEGAFVRARTAQAAWAATPMSERKRILLRFHDVVLARQDEALDLMQAESGKTRRDAFLEVTDIAITARYYARNAAGGPAEQPAVGPSPHACTVNVNEAFAAAWGSIDAPMGGMGDSGLGRRHDDDGILKYTEPQTVAHQRIQGFTPPARISSEAWAALLTGAQKVLKATGVR
ncbi:aldehyde dehydrogenase family protein [Streptomyces sp. NPDC058086]|uniref:aldehyde dehydrogenase family protein n=1 Tax=Streptomyces sp. NPDC058086 TaxID=3346334 RepID=UPI0036E85EEF